MIYSELDLTLIVEDNKDVEFYIIQKVDKTNEESDILYITIQKDGSYKMILAYN